MVTEESDWKIRQDIKSVLDRDGHADYKPVPKSVLCLSVHRHKHLFVHRYDKLMSRTHPINVYLTKNAYSDSALTL